VHLAKPIDACEMYAAIKSVLPPRR
jgi:hypothetical protein